MDGPVVQAAIKALEAEDVDLILPYVHKEGEQEVRSNFEKVLKVRKDGALAREVADHWFFETVVRIHRAGEGAPYTGLKPAGLDVGPVIPIAEKVIETGDPEPLLELLSETVRTEAKARFDHMQHTKEHADHGVDAARDYVEAMLGLQVWSHKVFHCMKADPHEGHHEHK
jgi:hypothetical protein